MKGIIYKVYNKISKKFYIGQTIQSLKFRQASHISYAKTSKKNYHFLNALRFYNFSDWEWSVVESDIEQENLNEREVHYIKQYDSFENGYNSNYGGTSIKVAKPYSFYHKDFGHIEDTIKEMSNTFNLSTPGLINLKNNNILRLRGWIMSSNIDSYETIINKPKKPKPVKEIKPIKTYTIVYKGIESTGTMTELANRFKVSKERIRQITVKPTKIKVVKPIKPHNHWIYTMTNGDITESLTSKEWSVKLGVSQSKVKYIFDGLAKKSLWKAVNKVKNT